MKSKPILLVAGMVVNACLGYSEQDKANLSEIGLDPAISVSVLVKVEGSLTNAIPVPPPTDASEPRRIIRYFCRAWKDEDFKTMYGAMSESYRLKVPLDKFESLFVTDIATNGGLKDENIEIKEVVVGASIRLKVQLIFRSISVKPRNVVVEAIKTPIGYRIAESGILPLDLNQL